MTNVIEIYGICCSGKTHLGREMQKNGFVDVHIELDVINNMLGKEKLMQKHPELDHGSLQYQLLHRDSIACVKQMITVLQEQGYRIVVTGLWPSHYRQIHEPGNRVIVMKSPNYQIARKRWLARGGNPERFDFIFPKNNYRKLRLQFRELAYLVYLHGELEDFSILTTKGFSCEHANEMQVYYERHLNKKQPYFQGNIE